MPLLGRLFTIPMLNNIMLTSMTSNLITIPRASQDHIPVVQHRLRVIVRVAVDEGVRVSVQRERLAAGGVDERIEDLRRGAGRFAFDPGNLRLRVSECRLGVVKGRAKGKAQRGGRGDATRTQWFAWSEFCSSCPKPTGGKPRIVRRGVAAAEAASRLNMVVAAKIMVALLSRGKKQGFCIAS